MALEYWRTYAVSKKDGERKCCCVTVWDTKLKKVVDEYVESYKDSKEAYQAWREQIPPQTLYR